MPRVARVVILDPTHFLPREISFPAASGQTALLPNRATFYHYDAIGRVQRIVRPDGQDILFTYDDGGRMTVLTTPSDAAHAFDWNRVDRNTEYDPPLSAAYTYEYDRDKRLKKVIYPSTVQVLYAYDDNRLDTITLPSGEGVVDYAYGDANCPEKLTSISKGSESVTFVYDGPVLNDQVLSGVVDATLEYGYSALQPFDFLLDNFTYAGGTEYQCCRHSCLYSGQGRQECLPHVGAGAFTIARESSTGLPDSIGDGTFSMAPVFTGFGEMASVDYTLGAVSVASVGLTYDSQTGEIETKSETLDGVTTAYAYDYSSLGQLEEVKKDTVIVEEYEYDPNGNRTYQKVNGVERWLTYDAEDRLDKIYSDAAKTVQVADYDYDVDGFLTTRTVGSDVTTYDYTSQGELLEVVLPDATEIEYLHDALGRRVAKEVDGVITEKYLWAGMNQGLLAVYNGSDNLVVRYEYASGRLPAAFTYASATYYPAYDQVGSLRAIFDSAGNKVYEVIYDSFGNILSESGTFNGPVPQGFAGGLHDRDTGLVLFGHRDYDPEIGRWTAKDPIGFAGGDVNLYGYVWMNPISFSDPAGLWGFQWGDTLIGSGNPWLAWDTAIDGNIAFEIERGAYATIDGLLPWVDPFEDAYADDCGGIDSRFQWSRHLGATSRDLLLIAAIPNLSVFARNPLAYEVGSLTVSNEIFAGMLARGLTTPVARGQYMMDLAGGFWNAHRFASPASLRYTFMTGGTPGARLALIGMMGASDHATQGGNNCGCP